MPHVVLEHAPRGPVYVFVPASYDRMYTFSGAWLPRASEDMVFSASRWTAVPGDHVAGRTVQLDQGGAVAFSPYYRAGRLCNPEAFVHYDDGSGYATVRLPIQSNLVTLGRSLTPRVKPYNYVDELPVVAQDKLLVMNAWRPCERRT